MKYTRQGAGEYLVLVHGALTDGSMWHSHVAYLASDFDVVSVTLRHFDGDDADGFGLNTHAQDLIGLVTDLVIEKPVNIVGWSYGADAVLNALVKQDLPVSKVLLYEPGYPGCLSESELSSWQSDASAMFDPVFSEFNGGNLELAVEYLIDGSANKQGYFRSQPEAIRKLQLAKRHTLAHQLNQKEHPLINIDSVSTVKTPVVLGYGEHTRDLFKLVTDRTSKLLNKTEANSVFGESHMFPQEKPEKFSRFITNILSTQV